MQCAQNNRLNNTGTHTGQAFTNMLKSQLMANSSPRNDASQKTSIALLLYPKKWRYSQIAVSYFYNFLSYTLFPLFPAHFIT